MPSASAPVPSNASREPLQPHKVKRFKLSNDPRFIEKAARYRRLLCRPARAHAVILSVDEKSQIQALDRTQPGLPMKPGRAGTMTHDYKLTAPRRCSPPSMSSTAPSSAATCNATSPSAVHPLPQHGRGPGAGAKDDPRHRRQLRDHNAVEGFFAKLSEDSPDGRCSVGSSGVIEVTR